MINSAVAGLIYSEQLPENTDYLIDKSGKACFMAYAGAVLARILQYAPALVADTVAVAVTMGGKRYCLRL